LIRSGFFLRKFIHYQAHGLRERAGIDGRAKQAAQMRQLRAAGAKKVFREVAAEPRPTGRNFAGCWPRSAPAVW
jgi:hypothetical protein